MLNLQFLIRGADAAFRPVTSVSFVDARGQKQLNDFIDGVNPETTNDATYTDMDDFTSDTGNITGFGFQIHSGSFLYSKY